MKKTESTSFKINDFYLLILLVASTIYIVFPDTNPYRVYRYENKFVRALVDLKNSNNAPIHPVLKKDYGFLGQVKKALNLDDNQLPSVADDDGYRFIIQLALWLDLPDKYLKSIDVPNMYVPKSIKTFFKIVFIIIIFGFYYSLLKLTQNRLLAFIVAFYFLIHSGFRYYSLRYDIYTIPLLAIALTMVSLAFLKQPNKIKLTAFYLLLFTAGLCNSLRSTSWMIAFLPIGFLIYPQLLESKILIKKLRLYLLTGLMALGLGLKVPNIITPIDSQLFWFNLHAGTLEFGGELDPQKMDIYPSFISKDKIPSNTINLKGWNDVLEYQIALNRNPKVVLHSKEFDQILKDDLFRIISLSPVGVFELILRRAWNYLNIYPWHPYKAETYYSSFDYSALFKVITIILITAGFYLSFNKFIFFLSVCLFPMAAPTFFVHSGTIKYNLPGQVSLVILSAYSLVVLINKLDIKNFVSRIKVSK